MRVTQLSFDENATSACTLTRRVMKSPLGQTNVVEFVADPVRSRPEGRQLTVARDLGAFAVEEVARLIGGGAPHLTLVGRLQDRRAVASNQ